MSSQTCSMGIQNCGGCRHTHMPSSHGSIIFQISAITCRHVFRFFVFPYEFTTLFSNDTTCFPSKTGQFIPQKLSSVPRQTTFSLLLIFSKNLQHMEHGGSIVLKWVSRQIRKSLIMSSVLQSVLSASVS